MRWNWQQPDWPDFTWDGKPLEQAEQRFLLSAGVLIGAASHLNPLQLQQFTLESMSSEALTTSEIEGEFLDRASVQSSLQRQLGLKTDNRRVDPATQGISALMVNLYRGIADPLSHEVLFGWHRMVMAGRGDLLEVGAYRTSAEPMQVVSGADYARRVHFEAPPSPRVPAEMERFVAWFNRTAPRGATPLPALTRAGIAHLYFESVHPFADGNGRIGRAIAEKALIQSFGETVIVGLATAILANRGAYYKALEAANKRNEVSAWLAWFAAVTLQAQLRTTARVEFLIEKTRFIDRVFSGCNERQRKVLLRMLAEGPEGFKGGLSAAKYSTISGASSATATRDLGALVTLGALTREGERKHTRYALALPVKPIPRITIAPDGSIAAA